jgi:hypothetical protein
VTILWLQTATKGYGSSVHWYQVASAKAMESRCAAAALYEARLYSLRKNSLDEGHGFAGCGKTHVLCLRGGPRGDFLPEETARRSGMKFCMATIMERALT